MNDTIEYVQNRLFEMQDLKYRDFQSKLIPTVDTETMIGVRTPELRALAKELMGKTLFVNSPAAVFLSVLPHQYFDENQLHAFIISEMKDYDDCMEEICRFLPYVDNWATCDQMSPKVFRKHRPELLAQIRKWLGIRSDLSGPVTVPPERTYTVRFAVGMLMEHFLDKDFDPGYLEIVSRIRSDQYYVNMMTAWYFATALAKQWDAAVPYIEEHRLDEWTHNKAIQKAIESRRITDEQKSYLRSYKQ